MSTPPSTAACLVRGIAAAGTLLSASLCHAQDRTPDEAPGAEATAPAPPAELAPAPPPLEPAPDPYVDAGAAAAVREARGDLAGAASALESVRGRYPQDLDLALRIAALRLRARDHAGAERAYLRALTTGGAPREALLGLAAAREALGRCPAAAPIYRQVLAASPGDTAASAGLARCSPPRLRATAAVTLAGQALAGGATGYGGSAAPSLDLLILQRLQVGATYRFRYLYFPTNPVAPAQQHEAYGRVGYGGPRLGVSAHYAFLYDQSTAGAPAPSHHLGATARYSPFGDGLLQVAASLYSGFAMVRVQPSWRFPLPLGFSIQPGAAYQWTAARSRYSAFLALAFTRGRLALWAGGRYGTELRPVDLDLALVSNYTQPIAGAVWAGAALAVGRARRTGLQLGWGVDLLRPDDGTSLTQVHALHLGVSQAF